AASASCLPNAPRMAGRGEVGARGAMVLSALVSRAGARAGELARYADQLRVAGQACGASYDASSRAVNIGSSRFSGR
uniref:DUF2514 family protein n=1 Tax=Pseudomonas viridiflava TaxID=33069 RepID=UPI000F01B9B6